ncbi:MAG: succinate dehydrogenase, cytochrome b556 subunit [Candidatus Eisenbacteria bacterium]|nr:succinate dehydrogenase, cytochrome b556 subunit [Candidatus Eisenbacteria bacterium]
MMYRFHTGYVAWLLNRISGILIIFYLAAHVWVTHHLSHGAETYAQVMAFLSSPLFKLLEIGLIGVVLYHLMNGIRIILVDFGKGAWMQKRLFWILMAIGVLLFVICIWELVGSLFAPAHAAPLH